METQTESAGAGEWTSRVARWVGGLGALALLGFDPPAALSVEAWRTLAVAWLMAWWWLGEAAPLAVTALVPMVAFPVLGVAPLAEVCVGYADPLLFLILGGFVLGHAVEVVGLHERFVDALLRLPGVARSPQSVAAALMVATAVLSMLISNTATMVTMLPIVLATARITGGERTGPAYVLAVAYAASIGGMATLVGTPTNAVLAGLAPRLVGEEIGFGRWMWVGLPCVFLMLPATWWIVVRWVHRLPHAFQVPLTVAAARGWRPGERTVLAVGALALGLWVTSSGIALGPLQWTGWGKHVLGRATERDAGVAVLAAILLFLLPAVRNGRREPILTWKGAQGAISWSILLLFGGGFALGEALSSTGVTAWVASGAGALEVLPGPVRIGLMSLGVVGLSELASNMATAQLALPLVAEVAVALGDPPLAWMVPATLAASCGFALPVATAANAVATEAGGVAVRDMLRAGIVVDLLGAFVVTLVGAFWAPWVFSGV